MMQSARGLKLHPSHYESVKKKPALHFAGGKNQAIHSVKSCPLFHFTKIFTGKSIQAFPIAATDRKSVV